jgi:hypothetical protein
MLLIMCVLFSTFSSSVKAQNDSIPNPEQFLFPEFSKSKVAMKSGNDLVLIMNYCILNEKMVVLQNGKVYDMLNQTAIDTAYLNNRKFIPVGKVFYEVLAETPFVLFVQHRGDIKQPDKPTPYGGTPGVTQSSALNGVGVDMYYYRMKDKAPLDIKPEKIYWLKRDDKLTGFKDATQLLKLFPENRNEIRDYIKQNKVKFGNPDNVRNLLIYCNGLKK